VAFGLVAGSLALHCPPSVAQETWARLPAPSGDFAAEASAGSPDAYDSPWGESASKPVTPGWSQRILRLARGRTQLEGGYSYLSDSAENGSATQHAFPDLLLRFGLTNRLELRLGWPGYVSSDYDGSDFRVRSSGSLDPNVGLAYDLWCQRGLLPQTAVLGAVPVTLEGNPFALKSLQPLAELLYAWHLGDRTAITGYSGFALFEVSGDNYTQFQQGLSCDLVLTERLGAFVSWDMLVNHGSWNDASEHMAGGGLSFLLTERLAISWRTAIGLNSAAPDFLNDVRFAYRF
jgi:hypothetical protein